MRHFELSGKRALISVIVPVYNVESFLIRCISSIREQTNRNLEIILIYDGSEDASGEICDTLAKEDSRISVIHKQNAGLSSARNVGLDNAKGEYISFIDSDDWVMKNYFENMLNMLVLMEGDIISAKYMYTKKYINEPMKKDEKIKVFDKNSAKEWYLRSLFSAINDSSCCTKLYRKSAIGDCRFEEGRLYEDIVFNWNVLDRVDKYLYLPNIGYYYYLRNNSTTNKNIFSQKNYDSIYSAEYIRDSIDFKCQELKKISEQYLAKAHFSILVKMIRTRYQNIEDIERERLILRKMEKEILVSPLSIKKKLISLTLCFQPVIKILMKG